MAVAAFFDVEGTIVKSNIVMYYIYFATRGYSAVRRALWLAGSVPRFLGYALLDKISRSQFNQVFYRNYRGMDAAQLLAWSQEHFETLMRPRIFPGALAQIAQHREQNEWIVLVTGSLDFMVAPLAAFLGADETIAAQLEQWGGQFTGELTGAPMGEAEKARAVRTFAAQHGIDLARSYAYGDSRADLPMLRAVGRPVAVNPGSELRRIAQAEGWSVREWSLAAEPGQR